PFRSPVSRPAAIAGSDSIGGRGHKSYDVGMPSGPSHRHGGGPTRPGAGPADLRADPGADRHGPFRLHHVLHKRSVLSISKGDAASALEEENVRVRATPFLVALFVHRAGLLGDLATRGGPDVIVWDRPRPALVFLRNKHNEVD